MSSKSPVNNFTHFHKATYASVNSVTFDNTQDYLVLSNAKKNTDILGNQANAANCTLPANKMVFEKLWAQRATLT